MMRGFKTGCWSAIMALLCAALPGCDADRVSQLEEGVSSEADVRQHFGTPEHIWDAPDGGRVFEYNRQPEGTTNYMITIGLDGKMSALRQVLTPHNFALVEAGLPMETVRRMLGKPMKRMTFALKQETEWDWRYMDPPQQRRVFTVVFDRDLRVVRTGSAPDTSNEVGATP
jgi:outer membrane protein assembly factor BamE (lipoprotein component of BamABCDE complex)